MFFSKTVNGQAGRRLRSSHDFATVCLVGLANGVGFAQPDPGSLSGILRIDPGTGAASLDVPLGPGIGEGGLRFVPTLAGRFSPRLGWVPRGATQGEQEDTPVLISNDGFTLVPGVLVWRLVAADAEGAQPGRSFAEWSYPDGSRSQLPDVIMEGEAVGSPQARFGYDCSWATVDLPRATGSTPATPIGLVGDRGELLLGLSQVVNCPQLRVLGPDAMGNPVQWTLPSVLLVIREGLAYEYTWADTGSALPNAAHYRLTAIRNDSGDGIKITYGRNGMDYLASWRLFSVKVSVGEVAAGRPTPAGDRAHPAKDPQAQPCAFRKVVGVRVQYEGFPVPLAYVVTALTQGSFLEPLEVIGIRWEGTGEFFRFRYGKPEPNGPFPSSGPQIFAPTVLTEFGHRGRSLKLDWHSQPMSGSQKSVPETPVTAGCWRYGVSQITDLDFTGPGAGLTLHKLAQTEANSSTLDDLPQVDPQATEISAGKTAKPGWSSSSPGHQGLVLIIRPGSGVAIDPAHDPVEMNGSKWSGGGLRGGMLPAGGGSGAAAAPSGSAGGERVAGSVSYDSKSKTATIEVVAGGTPGPGGSGSGGGSGSTLGGVEALRGYDPDWTRYIGTSPDGTYLIPMGGNSTSSGFLSVQRVLDRCQQDNKLLADQMARTAQMVLTNEAQIRAQVAQTQQQTTAALQQLESSQKAAAAAATTRMNQAIAHSQQQAMASDPMLGYPYNGAALGQWLPAPEPAPLPPRIVTGRTVLQEGGATTDGAPRPGTKWFNLCLKGQASDIAPRPSPMLNPSRPIGPAAGPGQTRPEYPRPEPKTDGPARVEATAAHGVWWDFCHKLGLIQTDADRIQNARGFLAANTAIACCDGIWVKPQDMTDEQTLSWWKEYTQHNKLLVAVGTRGFASMGGARLTTAQAGDLAKYLGFNRVSNPPFNSHGQAVFESGGRYITHDVDAHKGGVWKEFDKKGNRIGTLDALLNRIGD